MRAGRDSGEVRGSFLCEECGDEEDERKVCVQCTDCGTVRDFSFQ